MRRILAALSLITTVAFAVDQEQPTPYDLIRPVWPLVWDTSDVADGGTVMSYSQFEALVTTKGAVPDVGTMPQDFEANTNVPDSTSQVYLDARNMKIGHIRVNQAGYLPNSSDPYQHFYYVDEDGSCDETFSVVSADGETVHASGGTFTSTGKTTASDWTIIASYNAATDAAKERYKVSTTGPSGTICEGFLASYGLPEEERLRIKVGDEYSATFIISEEVYSMVRDAVLKFYGINRSGNSESWFHDPSHALDGSGSFVDINGSSVSGFSASAGDLAGGWYDCGDHLKESQTMAYAFMVVSVMAAANPDKDDDHYAYNHAETVTTDGIPDILREAKHGADFFLKSYRQAQGIIDNMVVSVGSYGADHGWWGRPEAQDSIPSSVTGRGGPHERDLRLGELGSNISSEIAAGLALLSVTYAEYDQDFADSCLMVAEQLYDFAKNLILGTGSYGDGAYSYVYNTVAAGWSSSAYNGNNEAYDDLGLAAIALHYATYDPDDPDMTYLNDAVEDTDIGTEQESTVGFWNGGWFAYTRDGMRKSSKNTSWANAYTFTLYAFYKLLLPDDETAASFGIDSDTRLSYAEKVALILATNIYALQGSGSGTISLPGLSGTNTLTYNELWFNMTTDQTWIYNRYQAGNIFEVLAYADVTKDLENVKLPAKGVSAWNSEAMQQLGINQLNYMLGVNPWDVSFLLGVGDKNDAHPHHRGSNPEGKNMPGNAYTYSPPIGALFGGNTPGDENSWVPSNHSWEDYLLAETCIDGTAIFLSAAAMAVKSQDKNAAPSEITVEIQYVGYDSAIVHITQDVRGYAMILYSTSETGPFNSIAKDTVASVDHTIILRGLTNGTTYYFKVVAINSKSENYATKWLVDSTYTPYYFTTLASEAPDADIQNVKVCNVTADSAEIMWYTPNGQYESKVYWDTVLTTYDQMQWNTGDTNADVSGIPVSFHYVKIGGLQEQTTYYFVVESNGVRRSVDDDGSPLKFTTPVMQYDFEVRTYQYDEGSGLDYLNLNIYNNEDRSFDSLTLRLYVTALPSEVSECALMMDEEICQAYDAAGFNKSCETDTEIRANLRGAMPVRLDDTYDAATGKYDYYFPIDLGSTTIQTSSRLRLDVAFNKGLYQNEQCDPLYTSPDKHMDSTTGDWTWAPHTRAEDGADYDGMWFEDKDWGDTYQAPVNPYVVVYRKDQFVSGYSPSYSEMTTKVANYEMTVSFDSPFDVTSGSYIEIDSTTSTMYVTGTAYISESGYVTAIWVNGVALSSTELATAAIYDDETGRYILNIPVKLTIGTNKVDITIFAGPDPDCSECQENGGCAFVNRNYYIQYSKGDRTASTLTLVHSDETSVSSPAATDGSEQFYIVVRDKDNSTSKTVYAYIINSRTGDSLQVELTRTDSASGTFKSELITAKSTASASYPTISFYGGDTITVVYIDAEDEEDVSSQSFYADPTHPVPTEAVVTADCSTTPEQITVTFSGSSFDDDITLDSASFTFDSTSTNSSAVTIVMKPTSLDGTTAIFVLDSSLVPTTGAPSGTAVFYMTEDGVVTTESISLTDGMAPYLISVTILENEDHLIEQDTLKIAFSEPVVLASKSVWPLRITDGENDISTDGISIVSVTTSDNGKSWQYVITGNDDGEIIKEGYYAEVLSSFTVSDMSMNSLTNCGVVTIAESVRPVPIDLARITDETGDGQPDEIYIEFESVLRTKDMLDSFDVYWGPSGTYHAFVMPDDGWDVDTVQGELTVVPVVTKTDSTPTIKTSTTTDSVISDTSWCVLYTSVTDDSTGETTDSVVVQAADGSDSLYNCGITTSAVTSTVYDTVWTYTLDTTGYDTTQSEYTVMRVEVPSGVYTGLTYGANNGRGTIMPRKGEEGGFFDQSYTLNDNCPPIVASATWSSRDLSSGQLDLLEVTYSEPLDSVEGNEYYLERRRSGVSGTYLKAGNIYGSPMNGTSLQTVTYMYYDENDNAVWIGDSVRMVSDESKGYYMDDVSLFPGEETPWVAVTGVVEKVKFKVKMLSSVTKRDKDVVPYGGQTIGDDEHWRLTIPTDEGELLIASGKKNLDDVTKSSVVSDYEHAGPVFKIEVTMPEVLDKTDFGEYKRSYSIGIELMLYNNLGTYVNEMSYKFNLDDYLSYVSGNSVLTLYLEWLAPEDAPYTLDSRQVGSGAFIGNFDFKAAAPYVATVADEGDTKTAVTGKSSKTITFGVRR